MEEIRKGFQNFLEFFSFSHGLGWKSCSYCFIKTCRKPTRIQYMGVLKLGPDLITDQCDDRIDIGSQRDFDEIHSKFYCAFFFFTLMYTSLLLENIFLYHCSDYVHA